VLTLADLRFGWTLVLKLANLRRKKSKTFKSKNTVFHPITDCSVDYTCGKDSHKLSIEFDLSSIGESQKKNIKVKFEK
jgi:hypothetical protein